jgi:hypothetical protein
MKRPFLFLFFAAAVLVLTSVQAQDSTWSAGNEADISLGAGSYRGTLSLSFFHNWGFGNSKRFVVGARLRFTSLVGANLYYITAPARLTSESTGPLVLFKENIAANIDSFLVKSPQIHSLNLAVNLGYGISSRITLGFNIDVTGLSFGKKTQGNYINGYEGKIISATPTLFNILLISDNDRGSLNSELYGKYYLNKKWRLKAGAQFLFTEYSTSANVQQYPEPNHRFRNKSFLFTAGMTYKL